MIVELGGEPVPFASAEDLVMSSLRSQDASAYPNRLNGFVGNTRKQTDPVESDIDASARKSTLALAERSADISVTAP